MKEVTVLVDRREKQPLPFPSIFVGWNPLDPPSWESSHKLIVHVRTQHLPTADYTLAGHQQDVLIERKKDLDELRGNLVTRRGRENFEAELRRMKEHTARPLILLEGSPSSLQKTFKANAPVVRDLLTDVLVAYDVPFVMIPTATDAQRRAAGEWVLSYLLAGARHAGTHTADPPTAP